MVVSTDHLQEIPAGTTPLLQLVKKWGYRVGVSSGGLLWEADGHKYSR